MENQARFLILPISRGKARWDGPPNTPKNYGFSFKKFAPYLFFTLAPQNITRAPYSLTFIFSGCISLKRKIRGASFVRGKSFEECVLVFRTQL